MKFKYGDKVHIIKGFYRGRIGFVNKFYEDGTYMVIVNLPWFGCHVGSFPEDHLELKKSWWKRK